MTPTTPDKRKRMEQGLMLIYLLRLNHYALQKGVITEEVHNKMETSIIQKYSRDFT